MNRDDLFNALTKLEKQLTEINESYEALKEQTVALVEENVALKLENDNLQRFIQEPVEEQPKENKVLQSKENLAMLYAEGFHICPTDLFGKHRGGGDCIFCLSLLSDKE